MLRRRSRCIQIFSLNTVFRFDFVYASGEDRQCSAQMWKLKPAGRADSAKDQNVIIEVWSSRIAREPCAPLSAFLFFCFSFSVFSRPPRGTEKLHKYSSVFCTWYTLRPDYISKISLLPQTPDPQKQSLSLRHNKALANIPSARSSLLLLQHVASKAREGCQPVRQTSSLPGPPTDGSVGHVSRGEQKAQTASQQSPGTASACEGLFEQGSCDCVPRNNGVEAGRDFSRMPRGNDNRHLVL